MRGPRTARRAGHRQPSSAGTPARVVEDAITAGAPVLPPQIPTLVLGWNQRAATSVRLLDSFSEPGSRLVVATEWDDPTAPLARSLLHASISYRHCDLNDREQLETLDVGSFQHVMVLSDDTDDEQQADARTLVTLLHLRDMEDRLGEVFAALFSPEGSEIHLKPAGAHLRPGATANFATVLEAARRRGETAIGFRRAAEVGRAPTYGVTLNPGRRDELVLTEADQGRAGRGLAHGHQATARSRARARSRAQPQAGGVSASALPVSRS